MAQRLQGNAGTKKVGVPNQGAGGNAILSGGLGTLAMTRFEHDILQPAGARWAIVFEGVNDISGNASSASLISAYKDFVAMAHAANMKIYGATISPFGTNSYYSAAHEATRTAVNEWIRSATSGYGGVIDMDAAVRDPAAQLNLLAACSSDGLHCKPAGYQKMADTVDLTFFSW